MTNDNTFALQFNKDICTNAVSAQTAVHLGLYNSMNIRK